MRQRFYGQMSNPDVPNYRILLVDAKNSAYLLRGIVNLSGAA